MVIYVFERPCIVMLENARSVILHKMTNCLLCMNPVKTSNKPVLPFKNNYVGELKC